ncbi:hypothetical protein F2P81_004774 [Scophthalmus maximus]|uniref:Uncharacterized protein n=1 Tax=Scophthalmus maximus TaxID=52904 RepID=A0A6A4TAG4_SCOMX|nr:hypothetical protein F2P81_004774 [Scophthalmus maximus]
MTESCKSSAHSQSLLAVAKLLQVSFAITTQRRDQFVIHMSLIYCCGTLVLLLLIPRVCQAGNILVVPVEGSHWLNMDILLKALHSRGHNITILRTSRSWYIPYNSSDYSIVTVQTEKSLDQEFITNAVSLCIEYERGTISLPTFLHMKVVLFGLAIKIHETVGEFVSKTIDDQELVNSSLSSSGFTALMTESCKSSAHSQSLLAVAKLLQVSFAITTQRRDQFVIHMSLIYCCGTLVLLLLIPRVCQAGNILVVPVEGSHWLNMDILLKALHSRGHNITILRTSRSWYIPDNSSDYSIVTVQTEKSLDQEFITNIVSMGIEYERGTISLPTFLHMHVVLFGQLIELHETVGEFVSKTIDDQELLMLGSEAHAVIAPSPISYVPMTGSGNTDKMNILQRVKNMGIYLLTQTQYHLVVKQTYQRICDKYLGPDIEYHQLVLNADIWLMRTDFVFEYPRPTMPNVVYMGGFHCRPAKPLPEHLEEFVQSSGDHGVIIMSLGTFYDNLLRLKERGGAKILTLATVDEENFLENVQEVLNEPSYRMNMQRLSWLHRDQPTTPLDKALFWIEFVMRHKVKRD